jgi:DNA-directed RNA polymerase II subunit RPB1
MEMNSHMAQSVQTMSELMDFCAVPYHIISPKDGKPVITFVQDTLLGCFRLTKKDVLINDKTFANLQMVNSYFDGTMPKPVDDSGSYNGQQAYSMILPPGLWIDMKFDQPGKKSERVVSIKNSILSDSGNLDKACFNSLSKGLIPVIFHDNGPFETRRFMDNTQRLICRWLMSSGFSVGISDLIIEQSASKVVTDKINEVKRNVFSLIGKARDNKLDNHSLFNNRDHFEMEIIGMLNDVTKIGESMIDTLDDNHNRMLNMVKAGSKGSYINVAQMIACVGQQNVDGKRITYGFTDRTLPHYSKFDDGPEARGFVENSFINGLTPQEVYFHAMGGREGLIDTAVKTSETGYLQRRLVKAMEDCKVFYDNTIRNATGSIVQFLYGEDGMDGTKIEIQPLRYTNMSILEMERAFNLRKDDNLGVFLTEEAMKEVDADTDWEQRCAAMFDAILADKEFIIVKIFKNRIGSSIQFPIPFTRIMRVATERIKESGLASVQTDLTPMYILDSIDRMLKELKVAKQGDAIRFLEILLRIHLNPKQLIVYNHLNVTVFEWVCDEITRYFKEAIVQPGEMVGIVAAQTLGEYSTQLTLNSFHLSGTSAASKATRGVPRLKELLGVTQNMKAPSLTIYLKPDVAEDKKKATSVRNSLEISKLSDILDYTEIYWDPPGNSGFETGVASDVKLMATYKAFSNENFSENCQSPWVLRMKLNRKKMSSLGLSMLDVYVKMKDMYGSTINCLFSDDNDEEIIFRIRMEDVGGADEVDADDAIAALKAIEWNLVHHKLLKGTEGILKVGMRQSKEEKRYDPVTKTAVNHAEWMMDTDGSNLIEILSNKNIDNTRTVSNDIWEIYQVLGIEGARQALYNEITDVIKESGINFRHVSLLIDTMTNRGFLMPIDRHGINRGDVGPLGKCSFEETTDMLIKASVFSEYDKINGVSANIMLGQMPPCGAGDCDVLLDEERYMAALKSRKALNEGKENGSTLNDWPEEEVQAAAETCSTEAISFTFQLPQSNSLPPQIPKVVWA